MEEVIELEALLLPKEVAEKLRIGESTVYHLAAKGKLPGVKLGGALRFRPSTLANYIADLERKGYGAAA